MEPTTVILLISIPLLIAGVALAVSNKRRVSTKNADEARERAAQRIRDRQFMDTEPENDPWRASMSFADAEEISNDWDKNSMPLTDEQARTIEMIFAGYVPPVVHRSPTPGGAPLGQAAGVPLNMSAFDDMNRSQVIVTEVEYLDESLFVPGTKNV